MNDGRSEHWTFSQTICEDLIGFDLIGYLQMLLFQESLKCLPFAAFLEAEKISFTAKFECGGLCTNYILSKKWWEQAMWQRDS